LRNRLAPPRQEAGERSNEASFRNQDKFANTVFDLGPLKIQDGLTGRWFPGFLISKGIAKSGISYKTQSLRLPENCNLQSIDSVFLRHST
jgi:hypothetical protein